MPVSQNIVIRNNDSVFVHLGRASGRALSEGITFQGWYFYAQTPKRATGIHLDGANEIVFRDGKLLGIEKSDNQIGMRTHPGSDPSRPQGNGCQLINSSVAGWTTDVEVTSATAQIISNTFELLDIGVSLAGVGEAQRTSSCYVTQKRFWNVTTGVRVDFGQLNHSGTTLTLGTGTLRADCWQH